MKKVQFLLISTDHIIENVIDEFKKSGLMDNPNINIQNYNFENVFGSDENVTLQHNLTYHIRPMKNNSQKIRFTVTALEVRNMLFLNF
jgi:hypothetical protein